MRKSFTNIFSVMLCTLGVSFVQAQTFSYTGSLQSITVPACADSVTITASGGEGGIGPYNVPGLGATIKGTFAVSPGQVLNIVVGQQGIGTLSGPYYCGSGGGGSYVWNTASSAKPMIVAGGGGGSSYGSPTGGAGSADSIPTPSTSCAAGGMNGNGGVGGTCSAPVEGGGGAGWISNGDSGLGNGNGSQNGGGGLDPANGAGGGYAGNPGSAGGYGGGGGCAGNDGAGGGGGGYNGGGGGLCGGTGNWGAGGGGGSYNVGSSQTNTAGANSGDGSVVIKFNTNIISSISAPTNVTCNGGNNGSAMVTASCGLAPYTFSWAPGGGTNATETGLTAGTYTVTVMDKNGLTSVATITVTQPAALTLIDTANSPSICKGSCTNINTIAFGGTAGYTYLWNTGATSTTINVCPTKTTTYTTTVTDANGCVHDTTTTVTIIPLPVVMLSAAKDSACVSSTTDALTASPAGGTYSGTGVTGANFNPSVAGLGVHDVFYMYTDTVTGCTNVDTLKLFVQVCAGVNEVSALDEQVKFYPNPFSQSINVDISYSGSLTITMFNMLGENVGSWVMGKGLNTINTQVYPSGVYMIQVKSKDGLLNKKLVKVN